MQLTNILSEEVSLVNEPIHGEDEGEVEHPLPLRVLRPGNMLIIVF